jgi:HAMP domain-containing protein
MKLAFKFNLVLLAIFALGSAGAFLTARAYLLARARDQVSQQARLMMETSSSTRKYTSDHIRPILEKCQRHDAVFYPESVPAFSATRMFGYLHDIYPEYAYREATLNPTNPSDRAVDWEANVVNIFRDTKSRQELIGEHEGPNGRLLYLARPIKAVESCLECHSAPGAAPAAMVNVYGNDNGFGWKLDEIVGAQIVSVPLSVPRALARDALARFMLWLAAFLVATLILVNAALFLTVIRPLAAISALASGLSKGNLNVSEVRVTGRDEISGLADSLNRINRLVRAMKLLGQSETEG